jgi:hypothetical protein
VKELIQKNLFVRPDSGKWDEEMEADMLAAMVALRKAMQEYPIKHAVSFHGSIKRAEQFREYNDNFTQEFPSFGELSTFHVSGQTPTGTRSNVIKQFAKADRSLVTNARCLTEGVDVPGIDCVLFADPKKSKVDIVQAVGRALRPAQGKKLGYVILPVLHDEDSEELKESGAFKEVIEMLAKLASQDERIIDEFRAISQGRLPSSASRMRFEFGERISEHVDIAKFTNELQIKCWKRLAKLSWRPFGEARAHVHSLKLKRTKDWQQIVRGDRRKLDIPQDIPATPDKVYKNDGWISWGDWLGHGKVSNFDLSEAYISFEEAREYARSLGLSSQTKWNQHTKGEIPSLKELPINVPKSPHNTYKNKGWISWGDWLGTGKKSHEEISENYLPFNEAREFARTLKLNKRDEWFLFCSGKLSHKQKPHPQIPMNAQRTYRKEGWQGWGDWLGTGRIANFDKSYRSFELAREFARSLKLPNGDDWKLYVKGMLRLPELPSDIPKAPWQVYEKSGWISMGDWLGTSSVGPGLRVFAPFIEAREFARSLQLSNGTEWRMFCKGEIHQHIRKPDDIPASPDRTYKSEGWINWGDWLGTQTLSNKNRSYLPYPEAAAFIAKLGLKSQGEWNEYCAGRLPEKGKLPMNIPTNPHRTYAKSGWVGIRDWLGLNPLEGPLENFTEAREIARKLCLKSSTDWQKYCSNMFAPAKPRDARLPYNPHQFYKGKGWVSWSDWLTPG